MTLRFPEKSKVHAENRSNKNKRQICFFFLSSQSQLFIFISIRFYKVIDKHTIFIFIIKDSRYWECWTQHHLHAQHFYGTYNDLFIMHSIFSQKTKQKVDSYGWFAVNVYHIKDSVSHSGTSTIFQVFNFSVTHRRTYARKMIIIVHTQKVRKHKKRNLQNWDSKCISQAWIWLFSGTHCVHNMFRHKCSFVLFVVKSKAHSQVA